jgi:DNA polymerase-3 subunit epsilon
MSLRQIVLDTETTGLKPEQGHRIIEIGCVELVNRQFTGHNFHCYLNPEREVDEGAQRVHGIGRDFLRDKPRFSEVAQKFLDYVQGAELIIHNAPFDTGFLNHELALCQGFLAITDYCQIFCTLELARRLHPGQRNSLDALCRRYQIDNSHRELHGALLDANILARVYLAMTSGQTSLFGQESTLGVVAPAELMSHQESANSLTRHIIYASSDELALHQTYADILAKKSGKVFVYED